MHEHAPAPAETPPARACISVRLCQPGQALQRPRDPGRNVSGVLERRIGRHLCSLAVRLRRGELMEHGLQPIARGPQVGGRGRGIQAEAEDGRRRIALQLAQEVQRPAGLLDERHRVPVLLGRVTNSRLPGDRGQVTLQRRVQPAELRDRAVPPATEVG